MSVSSETTKDSMPQRDEIKSSNTNASSIQSGDDSQTTDDFKTKRKHKRKRSSRLSLNDESKSKIKQKENGSSSPVSIMSYFQKISPTSGDSGSLEETENGDAINEDPKEDDEKKSDENQDSSSDHSNSKSKREHNDKKNSITKNKKKDLNFAEYQTDDDNDNTLEDVKDQKKVRFSADIKEFSPVRFLKSSTTSNDSSIASDENIQPEDKDECLDDEYESKKVIKNVFTFMMDSRHKSIGQNSPGKELQHSEESPHASQKENRKKLSLRKATFQDWADAKGAQKRKIEDQQVEAVIEKKLKKRAKRLKGMLTGKPYTRNSDTEDHIEVRISSNRKKRKRSRIIQESDSESIQTPVVPKSNVSDDESFDIGSKRQKIQNICNDSTNNDCIQSNSTASRQTELNFVGIFNKNKSETGENGTEKERSNNKKSSSGLKLKHSEDDSFDDLSLKSEQEEMEQERNERANFNFTESNTFTPRSYKRWQMRLKINLNNLDDEVVNKLVDFCTDSKDGQDETTLNVSSSDSDEPLAAKKYCKVENKKHLKPVKLAPIFMRTVSKPKIDPAQLEARKKFLHSGIPEQLRKIVDEQQSIEELDPQIFPTISHITVEPTHSDRTSGRSQFWNLSPVKLSFKTDEPYLPKFPNPSLIDFINLKTSNEPRTELNKFQPVSNLKERLERIKSENLDYPVYKAYNILRRKHEETVVLKQKEIIAPTGKVEKLKRGRPKKNKPQSENNAKVETHVKFESRSLCNGEIWTDLYRPTAFEEIFGNRTGVCQIKRFLETWLEFSEEINMQRSKRKRANSGSSSEFESADLDSRDSLVLPGNTLVLYGPPGSGKTSVVYALCKQLGINILELNASSKRTGKRMMQELQEATQSHQVQKQQSGSLTTFLKKDEIKNSQDSYGHNKKFCLLLIEDVDVVFEQDESFISALASLLVTSKRPLILTTTDANCVHLRRFFFQYPVIKFRTFTPKVLGTWLQVLCLIEGWDVDKSAIIDLLARNRGDIRRTLLQLQFTIQGGRVLSNNEINITDMSLEKESNSNLSWSNEDGSFCENVPDFQIVSDVPLDLGNLWWNLPHLINIPQPEIGTKATEIKTESESSKKLRSIVQVLDAVAMTDFTYEKLNIPYDLEPVHRLHINPIRDSLDLEECFETYSSAKNLSDEIYRTILEGCINLHKKTFSDCSSLQRQPDHCLETKSWRTKQYKCREAFLDAIPVSYHLDRSAISTDYCTTLRVMARTEAARAKANNKRNNRFYNYLRGLGINSQESIIKTACSIFK